MSKNARNRRNRPCFSRTVAGLVLVALTAACNSPTAPGPITTAPTPNPTGPTEPWPDISGPYTLTLSASSRCASELPEAARTRTFTATIAQTGVALVVTVPMTKWVGWINESKGGFVGRHDVMFEFRMEDWGPLEPTVLDFYARGSMTATLSDGGLSGFLDGSMEASVPDENGYWAYSAKCTAPDHRAVFSR